MIGHRDTSSDSGSTVILDTPRHGAGAVRSTEPIILDLELPITAYGPPRAPRSNPLQNYVDALLESGRHRSVCL